MIFSLFFEISLAVIGLIWVCNKVFENIISLIDVSKDIEENEKAKAEDKEREELTKHLYA